MKKLVVLTGAGVSAESGISTFRDNNGLWEQYKVEDVASIEGWCRNPALMTRFYNERRMQLPSVQPNDAHRILAQLEQKYDVTIITQNVDNLHEKAGSTHVIHLHGELTKVCSSREPYDPQYIEELGPDNSQVAPGTKAGDGSLLRPFIVFFGESVPMLEPAAREVEDADIFVVIGTSLNVYPAASLLYYTKPGTPTFLIDPNAVSTEARNITYIRKGASEGMKELAEMLPKL